MYGQLYHVHVSSFRYRGYVWRIKLFNQDEAWVSEGYDKLKLVDKRGRTVKPLSTKLDIFDMAITNTGDLLVTVTSGFHIKQVTGSGDVVAFANMSPHLPCENKNGDIVVIDFWESVKVIDEKGQHRFTYTGPQQTKTFEPYDIVCNHNEEILVLDHNNKNIQQLDKNGIFISYILTQQERLSIPTALTIDTNGELWIGCEDRQVHIVKYLT
ncbi:hypothetical protein KUTeg_016065 [Tegillarca granosa]|uniref:Uncharacterized protein n=1 Tax=Tegillarca granosa TaxID=220873 RepID=A0ABQ9EQ37_TEGGR|nr:hypothetical protein KUTeg_016065 [Tegillarca granosa]